MSDIRLDLEAYDRAAEVADGFWIIATRHRPGFAKGVVPEVGNRVLVFRLLEDGVPILMVVNSADPSAIPEVRRIERETGLRVRYLLAPGGGHHLRLPEWRDELTTATVLVPPLRIPKMASAKKLMDGGRVEILPLEDPLPQFKGQLDVVIFDGLLGFSDWKTSFEGGSDLAVPFRIVKQMMTISTPVDEVWLHHAASGAVIGCENLMPYVSEASRRKVPLPFRAMMKANTVSVTFPGRKVGDKAKVAAAWEKVLKWPGRALFGYHEPPGEGFVGDVRGALGAAVKAARQGAGT